MSLDHPRRRRAIRPLVRFAGWRLAIGLLSAAVVAGCASDIPAALREAPAAAITPRQVQRDAVPYLGRRVRWGGAILAVANLAEETEVEVLARPLGREGRPREDATGQGRFLARLVGFVDPAELPVDRELTISGRVLEVQVRPVGEYPYSYPVVQVEARYLWPRRSAVADYPWGPPGVPWYDPWWGPPYGPWWRSRYPFF